jgi:hypothetical protein
MCVYKYLLYIYQVYIYKYNIYIYIAVGHVVTHGRGSLCDPLPWVTLPRSASQRSAHVVLKFKLQMPNRSAQCRFRCLLFFFF